MEDIKTTENTKSKRVLQKEKIVKEAAKAWVQHKGVVAADQILTEWIEDIKNPDCPRRFEIQKFIVKEFTPVRTPNLIRLEDMPPLTTISNINEAETRVMKLMSDGIISMEEAERYLGMCKLRRESAEAQEITNVLRDLQKNAENSMPVSESLQDISIERILNELTSRNINNQDRLLVLTKIKENFIPKEKPSRTSPGR